MDRYNLTPSNTPSRYSSNLLKWVSSRLTVSCAIVRSISGMIYDAVYGFDVPAVFQTTNQLVFRAETEPVPREELFPILNRNKILNPFENDCLLFTSRLGLRVVVLRVPPCGARRWVNQDPEIATVGKWQLKDKPRTNLLYVAHHQEILPLIFFSF
ncbi:hypothetical protein P692DRAFT_20220604 [Suillus brevipes Sb2]|nr:hypothetical protein P692DRAFT_20220604 [Suillus brevipes Sb2]